MNNIRTDATGVLAFNGVPVITPMLLALFGRFNLSPIVIDANVESDRFMISAPDESDIEWAEFASELFGAGVFQGEQATGDDARADLIALASQFGTEEAVAELLSAIPMTNFVNLVDLFKLALLLNDGHNLKAIRLMGSYHSESEMLWESGGYCRFFNGKVDALIGTGGINAGFRAVERGDAVDGLLQIIDAVVSSVKDPILKAQLYGALGEKFGAPPTVSTDTTCGIPTVMVVRPGTGLDQKPHLFVCQPDGWPLADCGIAEGSGAKQTAQLARFFAGAPRMLAALQRVENFIEKFRSSVPDAQEFDLQLFDIKQAIGTTTGTHPAT